uniref:SDR family NAD(P)-dependent oxidoreductase n=1 Tax=Macrostomum lignano TaxID=282301 RepID=A0A1I8GE59_9PLAT
MERWRGSLAVVTGASSGIGAAVCEALLGHGVNVVGVARSADAMEKLAAGWSEQHPGARFSPFPCDLSDTAQVDSLMQRVKEAHGDASILVNNAGMTRPTSLLQGSTADWSHMLAGHVLNIASLSAHRVPVAMDTGPSFAERNGHFYSATKFALRAVADGTRLELRALGSPARVTNISPGLVDTPFHASLTTPGQAGRPGVAGVRMLQPGDVADAVVFALTAPQRMQVDDVLVRPTDQRL